MMVYNVLYVLSLLACTAISRAELLLPLLASAEQQLQQRLSSGPADSVDVENVGDDELHVEMVCTCKYTVIGDNNFVVEE